MQPRTKQARDMKNLQKAVNKALEARHGLKKDKAYSTPLPEVVGFKLSNQCNLRCKTCYEWNEKGYHRQMDKNQAKQELSMEIYKKVIDETQESRASIYFWGGEPLCHSHFDEICNYIRQTDRSVAICTNATLLDSHIDALLAIGQNLELLIALDGPELVNDAIRGQGTYKTIIDSIGHLSKLKKSGGYQGKISVHCVISQEVIPVLIDFLKELETKGVENIVLCYPWYLSEDTSEAMDVFYKEHFGDKPVTYASWHAFKYRLEKGSEEALLKVRQEILAMKWSMNLRFQPDLKEEEISMFMEDTLPMQDYICYSLVNRMDVLADGTVSSCKHFPEMIVGNLNQKSVKEIWKSDRFIKVRQTIQESLMPSCRVCNNLYLHGRRKINT